VLVLVLVLLVMVTAEMIMRLSWAALGPCRI
jgi:hypothetical protein